MDSLRSLDTTSFSRFTLHFSDDPVSSGHGQAGVGMALSMRAGRAHLTGFHAKIVCAVRMDDSVLVNSRRLKRRLVVAFVYAPSDYSSPETVDEFYRQRSQLLQMLQSLLMSLTPNSTT